MRTNKHGSEARRKSSPRHSIDWRKRVAHRGLGEESRSRPEPEMEASKHKARSQRSRSPFQEKPSRDRSVSSSERVPSRQHSEAQKRPPPLKNQVESGRCHLTEKNISVKQSRILYCVLTSGTSETRKLVKVPPTCIWPNVQDFCQLFQLSEKDTIFCAAPPSFDPFYLDVYVAFLTKSTLLMTSQNMKTMGGESLFR